jgi:hypothetical protein
VTTYICGGGPALPPANPDEPWCCESAVFSDGRDCACWVAVYSPTPTRDVQAGPPRIRTSRCRDCAYRPDSPERKAGEELKASLREPFTCHQGMPVLLGYTHPDPDVGLCLWAPGLFDRDNFGPIMVGDRSWKADGTTADLCAGWAGVVGAGRG